MIELRFLKVLVLIKQVHQKSIFYCDYSYFLDKGFKLQSSVCNWCYDVLVIPIDDNSIAILNISILNISSSDYRCIIFRISKSEAINLNNVDLSETSGALKSIT